MIKILNAYTQELDNPERAVREILVSLDIENTLLKNSVALLFCNSKCIETGVAAAVYKSLPFDVLGCTSMFFGIPAAAASVTTVASVTTGTPAIEGEIVLTVTILTSDDIYFNTGISGPLNGKNVEECVQELYRRTSSLPGEPPSLVFAFPPTMTSIPGDVMTAALDRACAGIPIFGSVALDMSTHIQHPKTIFKVSGENGTFSDRIALLLFRGNVKPRFFHSSFPEKSILPWDAVITEAEGHRIISINNRPALSFIRELGFFQNDTHGGVLLYPLVVEYPNNETKVVVLQDIDAEGQLLCGMNVQAGGLLNIGAITAESVLESARFMANELKKDGSGRNFLMFSCFLRNVVLGGSSQAEFELVRRELDCFPGSWLFINSGGELCPGYTENGETVNRFHEYALIACQF
jgi:hypothetical protein